MTTNIDVETDIDTMRPLPRPAGAGPGIVAIAWPTGRPIYPYTIDELAQGVDVYTRALKARAHAEDTGAGHEH